jgi:hypothetical protein
LAHYLVLANPLDRQLILVSQMKRYSLDFNGHYNQYGLMGARLAFRIEQFIQTIFRDSTLFERYLSHRAA